MKESSKLYFIQMGFLNWNSLKWMTRRNDEQKKNNVKKSQLKTIKLMLENKKMKCGTHGIRFFLRSTFLLLFWYFRLTTTGNKMEVNTMSIFVVFMMRSKKMGTNSMMLFMRLSICSCMLYVFYCIHQSRRSFFSLYSVNFYFVRFIAFKCQHILWRV